MVFRPEGKMKHDERCKILSNAAYGPGYMMLTLSAPAIAAKAQPGQFVHVRVPGLDAASLRRPFSIFNAQDGRLEILFKIVGRGTEALARAAAGGEMDVLGPLGRGFPQPAAGVTALLAGGGYGIAPLFFLARKIAEDASAARPVLFAGGRTKDDLLALDRFASIGVRSAVATNDGSAGAKGFVTEPLDAALKEFRASGRPFELFTCGPDGLLRAVAERALALRVPGWISMDRHMACGMGACFACALKIRDAKGNVQNARCCLNGPVFKAAELVWD